MADLTGMMQAAAGSAGGGGDGSYIAAVHGLFATPYFTLLDHTTPGTVSLSATYNLGTLGKGTDFSPSGDYIAAASEGAIVALLNHTTPGTVSISAT